MRVLLLQNAPWVPALGGANKQNRRLLEILAGRGHICAAVATASREAQDNGAAPVESFHLAGVDVDAVADAARLREHADRRIRSFGPDWVLVASEDPAQALLETACTARPGRVVYVARTTLGLPFGPQGFLPSARRTALLRKTAAVLVVSRYLQGYIRHWAGIESSVLPVHDYGDPPCLGRFDRGFVTLVNPCAVKGISIFLELARRLPEVAFAAVPTWGTTAADRAALEELANVRILPPSEDVETIFAQTRVLLVPSLWGEAFGAVVIEAMLRGIPVLASDVGGLPEAKLGIDYLLPVRPIERYRETLDSLGLPIPEVPAQDVAPWEAALRALLADRGLYERLSRDSRQAAREHKARQDFARIDTFLQELTPGEQPDARSEADAVRRKLDQISPQKLELLKRRLADRQKGERSAAPTPPSTTAPIPRQSRCGAEDAFPLSSAQQRLWFLYRFDPQSPYYNECFYARLRGTLRPEALAEGLNGLVRRHELLRTRFVSTGGDPVQVVGPPARLPLPRLDLRGLPEPRRWPEAVRIAAEESRRPFCLETGPILRCTLLRLDDADHLLVLGVHHIAADHWAIAVALRELSALYAAAVAGRDPGLPELPIQYADFAAWERQWLTGEALAGFLAYWRPQLAGAPPVLDLPADRPRPAVQSFRGAPAPLALPRSLTAALKARARAEGVTLYMLLLAAFQTLLHRSTGQEDLVVGTPVAGRNRRECEPLIGYFLNLLPLRGRPAPGLPFRELLDQARRTALEAFARQDLPFEQLVESLSPERSLSHAPLFQVLINLQNVPMHASTLADLELTPVTIPTGITKYDIDFYIEELDGALAGFLFYSTDLFDAPTVIRLLQCFESVLAHAAVRPEDPLGAFPLLSEAELAQTLREWNDTDAPLPASECLPQLFDLQAERTPGEPAVVCGDLALTYAELAGRANQMARHLRRLGVGPESLVGVLLDRTPDLVASLLGVAKAGGAYLPLDPAWPAERMAFMLEDSGAPLVVTRETLRALLPPGRARVLALDAEAAALAAQSPAPPSGGGPHPDHLAYVLYTSGSTGRPKGVQVTHRAFANFLRAMREQPGLGAGEALLAVTSLSFDIAGLEIFLPLITGGRVVLASREDARDRQLLQRLLASSGASAMQATPATWRMLVESGWTGDRRLKVLCGGEALPESLAADLHARSGEVWNLYGPTETTVWSAAARLTASRPVSLGRPIANTRIYILDAQGSPVPIGSAGELVIGGTGLARGYLGRPDLTAERFVPDGLGGAPGSRLYRTGDLARCRADGRLEHLGRLDHQIKLRGYRIEPGEIEAALTRHPGIREAAVVLREGALVAYLVPAGEAPAASELRDLLRANLPEAMIPAAFVALPALPLTPNRKVDRKALPAPVKAATAGTAAPPGTPTEEMIAGIWAEVLGQERIGARTSFFDLGGHSLLATRVVSRLRTVFGVELPLRVLFERTTVAELAEAVEEARRGGAAPAAPPLVRVPRDGSLPLSFAQERLWFLDRLQPGSPHYNLPVALEVRGPLSLPIFAASLDGIAARHEALRTTFSLAGARPVQVIAQLLRLALPRVDLDGLPEDRRTVEARRLARDEAARPFDLTRGPLMRATVLRLADDRHTVLFNQHHIVSDGWSIGVLVAELTEIYRALAAGGRPSLPDLPVQYADYAVWQRRWLDGEVLEARLRWWQERLAGAPHVLDLPTDRPRPAAPSLRGARQDYALPAGLAVALRELSRRQGVTLFMTLASLFAALLSRQTGAEDLLLGAPIAGRDQTETEGLIGLFVNTLVLRAELAGDPTFSEVLGRMREMTLGAYAWQDLPFEKLVDRLQPERSLAHTPLFQAMLILQNAPLGALELPGLTLTQVPVESGTARFDLLLTAVEAAGGLTGDLEFNRDLFDSSTIVRLLGHLRILAEGAVLQPDARLAELPLLSAPEAHQLLLAWNDTRIRLLDRSLRPVPIGVAGELCIGGVQLARGYWQRPDLTAERFVPDPLQNPTDPSDRFGARLYRTGDLARHLPDGAIELLGRIGHRVAALEGHPSVRQDVVVVRPERSEAPPRRPLEEDLAAIWREVLGVQQVGLHDNFFDLGGNSLLLGEVQAGLHRILSREVALVELLQHPTIAMLAAHLEGGLPGDAAAEPRTPAAAGTDIAVIGLEGRFPGAPDVERFWRNLREGVESIVPLADEQLRAAGLDPGAMGPDRVRAEPLLAGIDRFDAAFFGLTPREAEALDPQQRLFLEDAWSCLERAGYDPARYPGRIGVFAGSGFGTYTLNLFANPELSESLDPISLQTSIDKDFLATRVSYKLGLRGPSVAVQTACSTSLVAVHFARQSLLAGECDMALAGGVSLKIRQGSGYIYHEGAMFSPDGHCRAFDASARGTVFGSGSGVVLLKRLDAALRDGDTIHAVLKGSAINNDGALKVGFTAPSVDGQAEVVAAALEAAGVSPESITYVEANGTGTPLGDPVEVAALTQAFRRGTERTGFCALGSVKTNVGHLNAAAGIAGLIKTVLALEHRQIPPSLHFAEPNPRIDFTASPFYVNAWLADWTVADGPRRAGVSAFGIGGTNAHVILEEAPPVPPSSPSRERQILLLSARTPAALEVATRNLADFLDAHPEQDLEDVAWTLQVGRQAFGHRRFVVSETIEGAVAALRTPAGMERVDGTEPDSETPLDALGRLWLAGVEVDWPAFHAGEQRRRIPLPTYPFERQRFWVEAPRQGLAARRSTAADDSRFVAVGGGEDFRGLLRDPRNAEALQRLLALEPDLRVLLPRRAPEAAPAAGYRRPDLSTSYQAPQTGTELRLAAIWGDLLGIDPVGVHDDFFELGGNSLLATRLLWRLREAFGQEVPLATVFAEPTIARLAARLQTEQPGAPERPAGAGRAAPPLVSAPREDPLPLPFAQQRLWCIDPLEPASPLYNIPAVLRIAGPLDAAVLERCLGEALRRHEALRTRPAPPCVLPLVDLSELPGLSNPSNPSDRADRSDLKVRQALALAAEEAGRPFDLANGSLLRGVLARLARTDHLLALTLHHIASDGWSLDILVREVAALYVYSVKASTDTGSVMSACCTLCLEKRKEHDAEPDCGPFSYRQERAEPCRPGERGSGEPRLL